MCKDIVKCFAIAKIVMLLNKYANFFEQSFCMMQFFSRFKKTYAKTKLLFSYAYVKMQNFDLKKL